MKLETDVDYIKQGVDEIKGTIKEHVDKSDEDIKLLRRESDQQWKNIRLESEKRYAPKWVGDVVKVLIVTILLAVIGAILKLVIV